MPAERTHVGKMLDISDEDAAAVIKDIAVAIAAHPLMSEVVSELAAKYNQKAILAGMLLAKTFEVNERVGSMDDIQKPTKYPVNGDDL